MKTKILGLTVAISLSVLSMASGATIALNGAWGFNAEANGGGNIAAGSLVLIVVDTTGNGFLGSGIAPGDSYSVGSFLSTDDLIVGSFGATNTGNASLDSFLQGNVTFDVDTGATSAADSGDNFGLVWFDGALAATSTAAIGQFFGFSRGADWVLPAAPSTSVMGTNFTQLGSPTGSGPGQASTAVAPEPSRAVLAGLGLLGLFFRRRR